MRGGPIRRQGFGTGERGLYADRAWGIYTYRAWGLYADKARGQDRWAYTPIGLGDNADSVWGQERGLYADTGQYWPIGLRGHVSMSCTLRTIPASIASEKPLRGATMASGIRRNSVLPPKIGLDCPDWTKPRLY